MGGACSLLVGVNKAGNQREAARGCDSFQNVDSSS
jgi:hypothetical protein